MTLLCILAGLFYFLQPYTLGVAHRSTRKKANFLSRKREKQVFLRLSALVRLPFLINSVAGFIYRSIYRELPRKKLILSNQTQPNSSINLSASTRELTSGAVYPIAREVRCHWLEVTAFWISMIRISPAIPRPSNSLSVF